MPRPPASPSPPPAIFPYTTGSFDFPHASAPPAPGPPLAARRPARSTRRGPLRRIFDSSQESAMLDNSSRPRATPSERYLRRSQARIREERSAHMDAPMDNLFALSSAHTRSRSPTVQVSSERRHKRRKLDHGVPAIPEYTCFKYGHKGQVVPGRLRMEIVSCDGGEHLKDHPPGLYKVQNVLRNDKSVYCSESSSCNLLLKHMGEASFALEKVVIRAPDRGFTAPVQEGLVFVSMSVDDLLSGTSAYNLHYGSRSPVMSPTPSFEAEDNEQLSLSEALRDPLIWQHSRLNTQTGAEDRTENLRLRSERLHIETANLISSLRSDLERRRILRQMVENEEETDGDNCDHATDESYHGAAGVSAPTPPPFTVTTASEEEESDSNEEQPSAAIMADRLRRESRWRPDSDIDDSDIMPRVRPLRRAPTLDDSSIGEWREQRERHLEPIRATRVGLPSRIELSESIPDTDSLIPPHARFFIAKNKNKITIKFHPAISGKHVLLKFWSPKHDGNIDIESVQFYGYSGPRYFPAMEPR